MKFERVYGPYLRKTDGMWEVKLRWKQKAVRSEYFRYEGEAEVRAKQLRALVVDGVGVLSDLTRAPAPTSMPVLPPPPKDDGSAPDADMLMRLANDVVRAAQNTVDRQTADVLRAKITALKAVQDAARVVSAQRDDAAAEDREDLAALSYDELVSRARVLIDEHERGIAAADGDSAPAAETLGQAAPASGGD